MTLFASSSLHPANSVSLTRKTSTSQQYFFQKKKINSQSEDPDTETLNQLLRGSFPLGFLFRNRRRHRDAHPCDIASLDDSIPLKFRLVRDDVAGDHMHLVQLCSLNRDGRVLMKTNNRRSKRILLAAHSSARTVRLAYPAQDLSRSFLKN